MQRVRLQSKSATLAPNVETVLTWSGFDLQTALGDSVLRSLAQLEFDAVNATAHALYVSVSYQRLETGDPVQLNGGNPVGGVPANSSGMLAAGPLVPNVTSISVTLVSQSGGTVSLSPALQALPAASGSAPGAVYVGAGARSALDYVVQTLSANVLIAPFANIAIVTYTVPTGKRVAIQSLVLQAALTPSLPGTLVVSLVVDITTHLFVRSETTFEARLALAGEVLWLESGQTLFIQATSTDSLQSYLASGFVTLREYLS